MSTNSLGRLGCSASVCNSGMVCSDRVSWVSGSRSRPSGHDSNASSVIFPPAVSSYPPVSAVFVNPKSVSCTRCFDTVCRVISPDCAIVEAVFAPSSSERSISKEVDPARSLMNSRTTIRSSVSGFVVARSDCVTCFHPLLKCTPNAMNISHKSDIDSSLLEYPSLSKPNQNPSLSGTFYIY